MANCLVHRLTNERDDTAALFGARASGALSNTRESYTSSGSMTVVRASFKAEIPQFKTSRKTDCFLIVYTNPTIERVPDPAISSIQETKKILNITTRMLAEFLQVSHVAVYDWLKGKSEMTQPNRERIELIYELALKWGDISHKGIPSWLVASDEYKGFYKTAINPNAAKNKLIQDFQKVIAKYTAINNRPSRHDPITSRRLPEEYIKSNLRSIITTGSFEEE